MRMLLFLIVPLSISFNMPARGAMFDVNTPAHISCISDKTVELLKVGEYKGDIAGDKLRAAFFNWSFDKIKKEPFIKIEFNWTPTSSSGPKLEVITEDAPYHSLVVVRTKSRNSVIAVSSTSGVYTVVNWLFTFNFNLETMLASKVQSDVANVRGEVMTFDCQFEAITANSVRGTSTSVDGIAN